MLDQAEESPLLSLLHTPVDQEPVHPVSLSNPSMTLGNGKHKSPPEDLGVAGSVFSPQAMDISTRLVAINATIEKLPVWQKKTTVKALMDTKKYQSKAKVNVDAFEYNALEAHCATKYSRAFKGATIEYTNNRADGTSAQNNKGARATVDRWNNLELYSLSDKQLSRTVVTDAVNAGQIGVSPPKRGEPVKVGSPITSQLTREAAMM